MLPQRRESRLPFEPAIQTCAIVWEKEQQNQPQPATEEYEDNNWKPDSTLAIRGS
jgi:hypothetical protein